MLRFRQNAIPTLEAEINVRMLYRARARSLEEGGAFWVSWGRWVGWVSSARARSRREERLGGLGELVTLRGERRVRWGS